jgi:hypothetical protein
MSSVRVMSALPPKGDIRQREWHVRLVPIADSDHVIGFALRLGSAAFRLLQHLHDLIDAKARRSLPRRKLTDGTSDTEADCSLRDEL